MATKTTDPIGTVAAEIVAGDPELRRRLKGILNAVIDDMEYTLKFGTPVDRSALSRALGPALLRGLQAGGASAGESERAAAYQRMMAQLRGEETPDG